LKSSIEIVRGLVEVGYPIRHLVLLEGKGSVGLAVDSLVERVSEGNSCSSYAGPSWICGMPNKTKVSNLRPGDLVLESDMRSVRAVIRTKSDQVILILVDGDEDIVEVHDQMFEYRVVARSPVARTWNGLVTVQTVPQVTCYGDLKVGDEVVGPDAIERVAILNHGDAEMVAVGFESGMELNVRRSGPCVSLELPPPPPLPQEDPVAQPSTFAPTSGTIAPMAPGFCGSCGRERRATNAFCTGCGAKFSPISTLGFQT
jgi:hypothetical protein